MLKKWFYPIFFAFLFLGLGQNFALEKEVRGADLVDSWKIVGDISPSDATEVATLQKLFDDIALEPSFETWIKNNPQHFDAWKNWEATYRSLGDPVKDILGSGRLSHTDEWNKLIKEIEDAGGEVKFSPGRIAYSPGVTKGSPGQLIIDQDASITALRHEHRHFIDDQAAGYLGFEGVYDINFRVTTEYNAYKLEVQEMLNLGESAATNQLKQNFIDEVTSIINHLNLPITPELQSLVDDLMGL
ncbi:hypothetical protein KIM67_12760 [Flagellimonas sp. 389]|uniref:hypothetical protein n=1 Tax=Flagellimonas sp. 389 TaxID=2835862 RepID=UPI001BD310E8|nr:hypothetical protein [Flagellimonas sp. 389]MBS9463281.1 hypothetical protein [Flagellimonas sp. 389]